jgi:hypothetical protein
MPFLTHKHKKSGYFKSFESNYNDFLLIYNTPLSEILQKVIMKSAGKFVIQQHTRDGETHWDWMFEAEKGLETWQVEISALQWMGHAAAAKKIFDHNAKFLSYEGSVNNGAGKGKNSGTRNIPDYQRKSAGTRNGTGWGNSQRPVTYAGN